jgi:endoglucanase
MLQALRRYGLLVLGVLLITGAIVVVAQRTYSPLVFSEQRMLSGLWETYKVEFIEPDSFRTFDKQRNYITTSEGQSYTLLRAVWMDDQQTFDAAYRWTDEILGERDDFLFSWLFGEREDGSYGVIREQGGQNTASDANVDIALALLFAYARWDNDQYLFDARNIIGDIWEAEVITVNGIPYLAANDLEKVTNKGYVIVNPSYYAPYAYRIFAEVDPEHPWMDLVDSSYDLIARSAREPLNTGSSAGLPPDWIGVDTRTGELRVLDEPNLTTNYSFDALRIPWRLALDWRWYGEPRAKELLESFGFLGDEWARKGMLHAGYTHDGKVAEAYEVPSMYGGSIGYFATTDPSLADTVYDKKLRTLYNPDTYTWRTPLGYYDSNWAWFGLAMYFDRLPNLWAARASPEPQEPAQP